eukprot:TRINITY_DN122506_c0_g1_i1.p1 TRINITY_DN122506_c0_g1~~TRINITY_DN122506_c0_g1_i1.p1  ORF type:complete len:203 (+),score=37.24 TRINITY_DN122506_c0_g1_i1:74-682(+)
MPQSHHGSSPSRSLHRHNSEPSGLMPIDGHEPMPVARMPLRRKAAEIVALKTLCASSSTGMLQHGHLHRVRRALEAMQPPDEVADERGRLPETCPDGYGSSKKWMRSKLAEDKAYRRTLPREEQEPKGFPQDQGNKWVLRRGTWFFEGGPPEPKLTADEALMKFIEEETNRGRGPSYRNEVAAPGLMRRWRKRNDTGGHFDI